TYKLLIEKLNDFTAVTEISASTNPRTRVYKFDRPAGPVYVLWSETGDAPPNLDYRIPAGETVTFKVESDTLLLTHIITDTANTTPGIETLLAENRQVTIKLGYEPIFLEPILPVGVAMPDHSSLPSSFVIEQNYPNPFNPKTVITYHLPQPSHIRLVIYDLLGRHIKTLVDTRQQSGRFQVTWDAIDEQNQSVAAGVYFCQMEVGKCVKIIKLALVK
ncbi:MAG: T9SS type A sorting domain-containing protein, partial [bacterium]